MNTRISKTFYSIHSPNQASGISMKTRGKWWKIPLKKTSKLSNLALWQFIFCVCGLVLTHLSHLYPKSIFTSYITPREKEIYFTWINFYASRKNKDVIIPISQSIYREFTHPSKHPLLIYCLSQNTAGLVQQNLQFYKGLLLHSW